MPISNLEIRPERDSDRRAVHRLNREAFGQSTEAEVVDQLRQADKVVLSLVALLEDEVVGHILLSRVVIEGSGVDALGLAPMAVSPRYQRRGIGTQLVEEALERCRSAGHGCVLVVGHPDYYPRFGFVPASRWSLRFEGVSDEAFMALELRPGALESASGRVRFESEFDTV